MVCMRCSWTASTSCNYLSMRMRLYLRCGLSPCNSLYAASPDSRSGASALNARLTRSMVSFLGSTKSSMRAIRVESIPPENRTATLVTPVCSFSPTLQMHFVTSFKFSISNFFTFDFTVSMHRSADTCFGMLLRSTLQMGSPLHFSCPFFIPTLIRELAGISKQYLFLLAFHSAQYLCFQDSSPSSSSLLGSSRSILSEVWMGTEVTMKQSSPMPSNKLLFPKQSFAMKISSPSINTNAKSPRICCSSSLIFCLEPLQANRFLCNHSASLSRGSMGSKLPVCQISPLNKKSEPGMLGTYRCSPRMCSTDWNEKASLGWGTQEGSRDQMSSCWDMTLNMSRRELVNESGPLSCSLNLSLEGSKELGRRSLLCMICSLRGRQSAVLRQAWKKLYWEKSWLWMEAPPRMKQIPHMLRDQEQYYTFLCFQNRLLQSNLL